MAKKSSVQKYQRNLAKVARYQKYRLELKEKVRHPQTPTEEKMEAQRKLNKIPRSALPVRLRSRCQLTGRSRGYYRKFKLSRLKLRELAHKGLLPGVAKASW